MRPPSLAEKLAARLGKKPICRTCTSSVTFQRTNCQDCAKSRKRRQDVLKWMKRHNCQTSLQGAEQ